MVASLMPARKMRVELFDSEGNRYSIAFEGQVTRDKAVRLLDLVELLGGVSTNTNGGEASISSAPRENSKIDRVRILAQKSFPLTWFSSKELQLAYENEFKEPISLSTVATYLARLTARGVILKSGSSNSLRYRLMHTSPQPRLTADVTSSARSL